MSNEKEDTNKTGVSLPIEWYVPEGLITPFASNMTVQNVENVFKISFFEIKPPMLLGQADPPPSKIRADYISSVIVTPEKLQQFINALQRQLDKYKIKQEMV